MFYYDGWAKLAVHKPIWDLGEQVPCAYPVLDPEILSKCKEIGRGGPKISLLAYSESYAIVARR